MRRRILASLAALLIGACNATAPASPTPGAPGIPTASATAPTGPAATTPSATPAGTRDRVTGWQSDLALLVPGMERLHKDLYHSVDEQALTDAVTALSASAASATDDQLLDGVLRIVAMVSAGGCDAHTGAYVWGAGTYPLDSMPLRLWLFGDDVDVVAALPPYADLVGKRIVSVEGHPIGDVLEALDPLIPRDNEQTVRLLTPRFLLIPQILRGLGLADGSGPITIGIDQGDGTTPTSIDINPIPMADYNAWAGPYGLHLPADPKVLYLSRIDDALWWQLLEDGETLFVQYNRVDPLPATTIADLKGFLEDPNVSRVVLDLRHNYGGELHALDAVEALFQDPSFDQPGRLFVVTGRNTFSAGSLLVARLERDTQAEIVGEPMGGCPTFWSDPTSLNLPFSGIEVGVADDVAIGVDPNDTRHGILPDTAIELTLDDWLAGDDPVLDSIVVANGP
ncbi:MAG TPA: hypothetical protein VJ850_03355 [Candidatus Limnocylindrales bacterium]|nr:hypothetical protein [Candidatus Limnocylindrales bacterium]